MLAMKSFADHFFSLLRTRAHSANARSSVAPTYDLSMMYSCSYRLLDISLVMGDLSLKLTAAPSSWSVTSIDMSISVQIRIAASFMWADDVPN